VEGRLRFSKVLDLQKLTGRLLRTLDILGDGPFNQLSDTKLICKQSGHKSINARFLRFGFYRLIRKLTT
jgi:hypothetical protein